MKKNKIKLVPAIISGCLSASISILATTGNWIPIAIVAGSMATIAFIPGIVSDL